MKSLEQLLDLQQAYNITTTTNDGGTALSDFLGVEVTYDLQRDYEFTVDGEDYFLDDSIIDHLVGRIGWDMKDVVVAAFELAEHNPDDPTAKRLIAFIFDPTLSESIENVTFHRVDDNLVLSTWDNGPQGTLSEVIQEYFYD